MTPDELAALVKAILGTATGNPRKTSKDAVLNALADAQARRTQAIEEIRLLLAYARVFATPQPYSLGMLARVAGLSVSGVRTAYTTDDVQKVAAALAAKPHDPASTS